MDLAGILARLYGAQLETRPDDAFLRQHAAPMFLEGTVRVYRFYRGYLPRSGRILDWGCKHAPDACLMRADLGNEVTLEGCDLSDAGDYPVFFDYAGLRYTCLQDAVRLPYADGAFDAIVASGVLEHVAMDYESLKELHRVLRPRGRLILTYLPNSASVEEWWLRSWRKKEYHLRTYTRSMIRGLLLHTGFRPLAASYQTQLDALAPESAVAHLLGRPLRLLGMHRLTSCLSIVAEKSTCF